MLPSPEQYAAMLDGAAAGRYAFAAVNVTSSQTLNAAMRGFAEAGSDGIVQVTVGGARYLAGPADDALADLERLRLLLGRPRQRRRDQQDGAGFVLELSAERMTRPEVIRDVVLVARHRPGLLTDADVCH